jgi:hypothetical protein
MRNFIDAIEQSLAHEIWYGALGLSLMIPDVCSAIEHGRSSGSRYAAWFDTWVRPKYTLPSDNGRAPRVLLSGNDCYAFRCSYLHQGISETGHQKAKDKLDGFRFVSAPKDYFVHMNTFGTKLQLQIDHFCRDITSGAENWLTAKSGDPKIESSLSELLEIEKLGRSFRL